jgi:two-component system, LytTR family, response regulator
MNKFRVIIIDDERLAREEMKRHLLGYPDFEVAGEAENADEAEAIINAIKPDFIFLDIQMPGRSGFDLLESLDDVPEIIFTTAFDNYAVKAFEINAMDYLVKPIREERFAKAIDKIRTKLGGIEKTEKILSAGHTIFVKEGERFYFIKLKDIYIVESAGNYARLYFGNKKVHIKRSLNQLEKTLDTMTFFRINRTIIINTSYIKQIKPLQKGRLTVCLKTGETFTVSTRQSAAFKTKNIF